MIDVERLRALLDEATPGPWKYELDCFSDDEGMAATSRKETQTVAEQDNASLTLRRGVPGSSSGHCSKLLGESPTYRSWRWMMTRCCYPSSNTFPDYGGRGVTVCDRWKRFVNFLADMGERPTKLHSVDRIDNARGYEPGNCRWATPAEQSQNQKSTKLTAVSALEIANRSRAGECPSRLAAEFMVARSTILQIRRGSKWTSIVGAWRKGAGE